MMRLLHFFIVLCIKVLLTKILIILGILLITVFKGVRFQKSKERWNQFFLELSLKKITIVTTSLYLFTSIISTYFAYQLLRLLYFDRAGALSCIIFIATGIVSWYKFKKDGTEKIRRKLQDLKQTSQLD